LIFSSVIVGLRGSILILGMEGMRNAGADRGRGGEREGWREGGKGVVNVVSIEPNVHVCMGSRVPGQLSHMWAVCLYVCLNTQLPG